MGSSSGRSGLFFIDTSSNILVSGNDLRGMKINSDSTVSIINNSFYQRTFDGSSPLTGSNYRVYLVIINSSDNITLNNNNYDANASGNRTTVVQINSSSFGTVIQDTISFNHGYCNPGTYVGRAYNVSNSSDILLTNNYVQLNSGCSYGFDINGNSENISIRENTLLGDYTSSNSIGFRLGSSINLEVDSNIVKGWGKGIDDLGSISSLQIRHNIFDSIYASGTILSSDSGVFTDNIINSIVGGNGISINGNGGANVSRNKILGVTAGSGIVVDAPNSLVANNYVQSEGVGLAKGISLESNGSGSDVVFNSVNVTGTDVVNGQGITSKWRNEL